MFCPNCGIEYRPGFTHCNDCDVDLVEQLPSEEESGEGEAGEDSLDLLWRGTQGHVFNEISLALEEAGIRFNQEKLDARLSFSSGYAPLDIWVPAAEMERARKVLDETLARIAQPVAQPAADASVAPEEDDWDETGAVVEDPYPEDAVAQVWVGGEERMALFLKSCLATNGIGCHVAEGEGDSGAFAVRVLPGDEARAKEIVRQVVEGIPPG